VLTKALECLVQLGNLHSVSPCSPSIWKSFTDACLQLLLSNFTAALVFSMGFKAKTALVGRDLWQEQLQADFCATRADTGMGSTLPHTSQYFQASLKPVFAHY
jgi:hypothetical protein